MVRGINDGSIVVNKGRHKTAFNKLAKNAFNEKTGCRMLEAFKRNITLMNLIETKFPPTEIETIKGNRDVKAFEQLCYELNFRSFLETFGSVCSSIRKVLLMLKSIINGATTTPAQLAKSVFYHGEYAVIALPSILGAANESDESR